MRRLVSLLRTGKHCLMTLTALSLLLSLSACSSAQVVCKPPAVTPWQMEQQPLELNLQKELFETLSD